MSFSKDDNSGSRVPFLGAEANNTDGDDSVDIVRTKSPQSAEEVALEASVPTDADVSTLFTLTDRRMLPHGDNATQLHYSIAMRRGGYADPSVASKFSRTDRTQRGLRGTNTTEPVRALRINYTKSKPEITIKDRLAADRSDLSSSSCVRYKVTMSPRKNFVNYLDTSVESSSSATSPDSPPALTTIPRINSPKRSPRLKQCKQETTDESPTCSTSSRLKLEFDSDDSNATLPRTPPHLQRIVENTITPTKNETSASMKHALKQKWKQITEQPREKSLILTPTHDTQSKNGNQLPKPRSSGKKVDAFRFLRQTSSGRIVKRTRLAATDVIGAHEAMPESSHLITSDSPEDHVTYYVKTRPRSLLQTPTRKDRKETKSPSPNTNRVSSRKNSETEEIVSSSDVSSWSGSSIDTDTKSLTERLEDMTNLSRHSEDGRSISGKSDDLRSVSEKSEDARSLSEKSYGKHTLSCKSEDSRNSCESTKAAHVVSRKMDDVFVDEKLENKIDDETVDDGAKGSSTNVEDCKSSVCKMEDAGPVSEKLKEQKRVGGKPGDKRIVSRRSEFRPTRFLGEKSDAVREVFKSETINGNSECATSDTGETERLQNVSEEITDDLIINRKADYTVRVIEKAEHSAVSPGSVEGVLGDGVLFSDHHPTEERQLRKRKARHIDNKSLPVKKTRLIAKRSLVGPLDDSKDQLVNIKQTLFSLPGNVDNKKYSEHVSNFNSINQENALALDDFKPEVLSKEQENAHNPSVVTCTKSLECKPNVKNIIEPKAEPLSIDNSVAPYFVEVPKDISAADIKIEEKSTVEQKEVGIKTENKDNQPIATKRRKLVRELHILIEESKKATKLVGSPKARLRAKPRGFHCRKRTECEQLVAMLHESTTLQPLISTIDTRTGFQLRKLPLTTNRPLHTKAKLQRELVPIPATNVVDAAKSAVAGKDEKIGKKLAVVVKRTIPSSKSIPESKKPTSVSKVELSSPKKRNMTSLVAQKKKAIKMQLSLDQKKKRNNDKKNGAPPQQNLSYSAKAAKQRLLKDLKNKVKAKLVSSPSSLSSSSSLSVCPPITSSAATNFHWIQPATVGAPLQLSSDALRMYSSQGSVDLTSSNAQSVQTPSFFLRVPVISLTPTPIPNNLIISSCSTSSLAPSAKIKNLTKKISDSKDVHKRSSVRQAESAYKYKEIAVKSAKNYTQILLLSNTKLKHGLNPQVFRELKTAFASARKDPNCRVILLSSTGSVFCSGLDLAYLMKENKEQRQKVAVEMVTAMKDFLRNLISFPRPVVAAVNGAAIGLGVTLLPLCDIVYASDKATFYTPYAKLNQVPEGCASCTLPKFMNMALVGDLLYGNRRLTAEEAHNRGLVSQVFWPTMLQEEVIPRIIQMASQNVHAMEATKALLRQNLKAELEVTLENECQLLMRQWCTADCQRAMKSLLEQEEGL